MARNPDSVIAEAYRGLRTRVIAAAAERSARTLLITSPAWEHKSTVAANLAAALAQSGRRTVLVCADFRWGSIPCRPRPVVELCERDVPIECIAD